MEPNDIIQLIIALFTAIAAGAAWNAVRDTRIAARAQLFVGLVDHYFGDELGASLVAIGRWKRKHNANLEPGIAAWAGDVVTDAPSHDAQELDSHRRAILAFYRKATALLEEKMLSDSCAAEVRSWKGRELFERVVFPLTRAKGALFSDTKEIDDFYRRYSKAFKAPESAAV